MKKKILIFLLIILSTLIFNSSAKAFELNCAEGYIQQKNGNCYNPKTKLSYDSIGNFYLGAFQCGYKCNDNGRNCEEGICNVLDCADGYTEMKKGKCYNPKKLLSYEYDKKTGYLNHNITFYYEDFRCGFDCNFNGRRCQRGICNIEDCPKGYKKIIYDFSPYWSNFGTCVNEKDGTMTFKYKLAYKINSSLSGLGPSLALALPVIVPICFIFIIFMFIFSFFPPE